MLSVTDKIDRKLLEIGRNTETIYSDSKPYNTMNSNQLQGGIINIITGGVKMFLDKDSIKVDKLGKWTAFQLKKNNKKVVIIIFYHISNSSVHGVYKSIA